MEAPYLKEVLDQFACEGLDGDWHAKHALATQELEKLLNEATLLRAKLRVKIAAHSMPPPADATLTGKTLHNIVAESSIVAFQWVLNELGKDLTS